MNLRECPKCGGPIRVLGGCSAHPNNWYCEDEGCGWQAWNTRAALEEQEQPLARKWREEADKNDRAANNTLSPLKGGIQARTLRRCANDLDSQRNRDRELYEELLMAVARKHPGETRHETALRYIQQAEEGSSGPEQESRQHLEEQG